MDATPSRRATLAAMLLDPDVVVGIDIQTTITDTGSGQSDGKVWSTHEVSARSVTLTLTRPDQGGTHDQP